jgi:predicted nucleic-acid-binding protein
MGWRTVRITADTNILVRAVTGDDARQSKLAQAELENAERVALTLPALCELVWVLSQGYRITAPDIAETIRRLMNGANVAVNRPAVEAGLSLLAAGGDFADAVIAYEGRWLGADAFLTFDKKAAKLLDAQGGVVRLLS